MAKYIVLGLRIANVFLWIAFAYAIGFHFVGSFAYIFGEAIIPLALWFAFDRCIVKSAHQIAKALAD